MKKHFYVSLLTLVLLFLASGKTSAQISFVDKQFTGLKSDFQVNTPTGVATATSGTFPKGYSNTQVQYSVTIHRPNGFVDNAYVTIYSGITGPLNSLNPNLIATQTPGSTDNSTNKNWTTSGGQDNLLLRGYFSTANIAPADTYLYAVAVDISSGVRVVSDPIALSAAPVPPTPTPGYTYFTCANGNVICGDQCIPNGSSPSNILGGTLDNQSYSYEQEAVHWEFSSDY